MFLNRLVRRQFPLCAEPSLDAAFLCLSLLGVRRRHHRGLTAVLDTIATHGAGDCWYFCNLHGGVYANCPMACFVQQRRFRRTAADREMSCCFDLSSA